MRHPDTEKLITFLRAKWTNVACPFCGTKDWKVSRQIYHLLEYSEGRTLTVGGPVLPISPVTCGNCGNVVLVSAIASGLVAPDAPESNSSE